MDESEVVKCELKGHQLEEDRGQIRCVTEGGKIVKERNALEKMFVILDKEGKVFDQYTFGMLCFSGVPFVGWTAPLVFWFSNENSIKKEIRTIRIYGSLLAIISNLIALCFIL